MHPADCRALKALSVGHLLCGAGCHLSLTEPSGWCEFRLLIPFVLFLLGQAWVWGMLGCPTDYIPGIYVVTCLLVDMETEALPGVGLGKRPSAGGEVSRQVGGASHVEN